MRVFITPSLIVWVGCHIDAYEQAKWFGDDLALKGDFRLIDATGTAPLKYVASHLGAGRPLLARARMGVRFVAGGHRDVDGMLANHWYAADTLARRLGLGQEVCDTIGQTFERWDGKGSRTARRARTCCRWLGSLPWPTWFRSITAPRVMTGR